MVIDMTYGGLELLDQHDPIEVKDAVWIRFLLILFLGTQTSCFNQRIEVP